MTFLEWLIIVLATAGTIFMFISAVGVLRMPGIYARMHAVGKAATLGVGLLLIAAGIHFGWGEMWRMAALVTLSFVTAPVATTAMARASYRCGPRHNPLLKVDDPKESRYRPLTEQEILQIN